MRMVAPIWLMAVLFVMPARVQEGHPMTGSWVGYWGPSATEQHRVVIELKWTGKQLVGTINPGPKAIPMKVATVNPADWSLHAEADAKDDQGRSITYVIDGKIDDLGTYNRSIAGTWNAGNVKGEFKITRQ